MVSLLLLKIAKELHENIFAQNILVFSYVQLVTQQYESTTV